MVHTDREKPQPVEFIWPPLSLFFFSLTLAKTAVLVSDHRAHIYI